MSEEMNEQANEQVSFMTFKIFSMTCDLLLTVVLQCS